MRKLTVLLLVLLMVMSLIACGSKSVAETTTVPVTETPTTEATETPTTEATEAPTTEATAPSAPAELSYDEYFASVVSDANTTRPEGLYAYYENGKLMLNTDGVPAHEKVLFDAEPLFDGWMSYNMEEAAFVTEDCSRLLSVDYETLTVKTLYEDPYKHLAQPAYYDMCLFFIAGTGENTLGIYRMYLPTGQVDLLADGFTTESDRPGVPSVTYTAVSNWELAWRENVPLLRKYGEECWEKPIFHIDGQDMTPAEFFAQQGINSYEEVYSSRKWSEPYINQLEYWLLEETGEYAATLTYCNFLTGEQKTVNGFQGMYNAGYYVDADGETKEIPENGAWWEA